MGPYKVYYMNTFVRLFAKRDDALDFVLRDSNEKSRSYGDYEILDRSDWL